MCLVIVAFGAHPEYPLIVAGNRDEFHARPTQDAHWWPDNEDVLGGRDLQAGGTWLALHRRGRFATVTNYRDAQHESGKKASRGHLVTGFLAFDGTPLDYLRSIAADEYAGFNLLVGDGETLAYMSNRGIGPVRLEPGIYGLSNASLDAPWSKVERSKAAMKALLDDNNVNPAALMRLLDDRDKGPSEEVEKGRLPFATAHAITAPFIILPDYGTRCSSVVLANAAGNWQFQERRFAADGTTIGETRQSFRAQP